MAGLARREIAFCLTRGKEILCFRNPDLCFPFVTLSEGEQPVHRFYSEISRLLLDGVFVCGLLTKWSPKPGEMRFFYHLNFQKGLNEAEIRDRWIRVPGNPELVWYDYSVIDESLSAPQSLVFAALRKWYREKVYVRSELHFL